MIKGGFIGFGRMGITHFSILNSHPLVKVVAVCDQSGSMMSILKKYVNLLTFSDFKAMINDTKLDFIVVSTPTDSHTEIINYTIDHDLHTFTEKPFALTPAEGIETLAHIRGKNLVNQVGYVNRFNEVFMEVKSLLEIGTIGKIQNFSSEMYGATVLKDSKSSWRSHKMTGGGCMYEFASHCIDLAIYLLGEPDKVIGSVMQSVYSKEVEDIVSSTFIYNKGFSGTIMVNWSDETFRKPTNIIKIFGDKGKIIADKHAYKIYLKENNPAKGFQKGWNIRYITDFSKSVRFYVRGNEFTRQLDYFVDCIEQKRSGSISSFAEALKTDIVMDSIKKDAERSNSMENCLQQTSNMSKREPVQRSKWKRFLRRRSDDA